MSDVEITVKRFFCGSELEEKVLKEQTEREAKAERLRILREAQIAQQRREVELQLVSWAAFLLFHPLRNSGKRKETNKSRKVPNFGLSKIACPWSEKQQRRCFK